MSQQSWCRNAACSVGAWAPPAVRHLTPTPLVDQHLLYAMLLLESPLLDAETDPCRFGCYN